MTLGATQCHQFKLNTAGLMNCWSICGWTNEPYRQNIIADAVEQRKSENTMTL